MLWLMMIIKLLLVRKLVFWGVFLFFLFSYVILHIVPDTQDPDFLSAMLPVKDSILCNIFLVASDVRATFKQILTKSKT